MVDVSGSVIRTGPDYNEGIFKADELDRVLAPFIRLSDAYFSISTPATVTH